MARQGSARPDQRPTPATTVPRLARATRIGHEAVRRVQGRDLVAGDVLLTGVVLQVEHVGHGEYRVEMPGSTIHYVDHDEIVTVLARVDDTVLDAVSVGVYASRRPARVR